MTAPTARSTRARGPADAGAPHTPTNPEHLPEETAMSTATTDRPRAQAPEPARAQQIEQVGGLSFGRLLGVELRKMLDTRAARWMLYVIVGLTALAMAAVMWFSRDAGASFLDLLAAASTPQGLLLPVLGIMTVASEWGQRTALITFSQEPRRMRVMAAKTVAAVLVGLVVLAITLGLGALGHVLSAELAGGTVDLGTVPGHMWLGILVMQVGYVVMGVAFGAVFLSTPLAIAAFFVLPQIVTIVLVAFTWTREHGIWFDFQQATGLLLDPAQAPAAQAWQQTGTAALIWVVLPLVVGLWRIARREVK